MNRLNKKIKKLAISDKQRQDINFLIEHDFTKEYLQELLSNWGDIFRYKEVLKCSPSEIEGATIDCEFVIFQDEEINNEYYDKEIDLNGSKILKFRNNGYVAEVTIEYNGNIFDLDAYFDNCYLDKLNDTIISIKEQHINTKELLS